MRKSFVFAAAGAGLFLAGCMGEVMPDRRYIPIAKNDPVVVEEKIEESAPAVTPVAEVPVQKNVFKYEPMTDAVSSGGVDNAPKRPGKNGASAKGGFYVVKRGDTPGSIARKNKVKLSALMKANNLDEASARKLQVGQKLVIPGKDGAVCTQDRTKKAVKKVQKSDTAPAPALDGGKYTIKSGDTPDRIARRYKIKLSDLLKANNLDEASARKLQIGQKLVIPGKEIAPADPVAPVVPMVESNTPAAADAVPAAAVPAETAPATTEVISETVTVADAPAVATEGNANIEPFEVPADMTYAELAAQKGVSEEELKKLNSHVEKLTKGTLILLPKK